MDFLRFWFFGVAGAAAVGVFALAVTPQGSTKKVVQIASALVLCIAVLRPFTGFNGLPEFDTDGFLPAMQTDFSEASDKMLSSLIADRTAAYIVNKAQALGLAVSVSVTCRTGDHHYPEPWSVTVRHERPEHAKSALGKLISQDLDIPPERQSYIQK
ncbi:MAG: hypothetical protein FWG31_04775 [Oscillospiraceae bacterium]|nr:hypothetical protein [Oscillospiraceae bacterium]